MFAKVFKSGNSLALRIPKELADFFNNKEIRIHRGKNNTIILEKITTDWDSIFEKCYAPDFPEKEAIKFASRDEL